MESDQQFTKSPHLCRSIQSINTGPHVGKSHLVVGHSPDAIIPFLEDCMLPGYHF